MNQPWQPKLQIPPQLTVSEEGSFAYYTFTYRVPAIIQQVISENKFAPSIVKQLESLSQNLLQEKVHPLNNDGGTDLAAWAKYIEPYQGKSWLDSPFYLIEVYFFRRLLEIIEYFKVDPEQRQDPFELQKHLSLVNSISSIRLEVREYTQNLANLAQKRDKPGQKTLLTLLYLNLWSNRADLSLKPTKAGHFNPEQIETKNQEQYLVLNDAPLVVEYLTSGNHQRLDLIVDNAGFELISDLLVIDFLLTSKAVEVAYLHLKAAPIFVSDAMIKDVHQTLTVLINDQAAAVSALASRLQNYLNSGQLQLRENPFWTTPLFFWSMPDELRQELAKSSLVVIKGDANYRRLVGDCHWSKTANFADICCYFPAPLVTLRTLKSEVIVGLEKSQIEQLNREDPQWLINGQRGLIKFLK